MSHHIDLLFNDKTRELIRHSTVRKFQKSGVDLAVLGEAFTEERVYISQKLSDSLDQLVEKYEKLSLEKYNGLCAEVSMLESDIANDFLSRRISKTEAIRTKRSVFFNILRYLFPDKPSIRWGRIIAMLAFTRELILYETRQNLLEENMAMMYVDWVVEYITTECPDIQQWIMDQPKQWDEVIQYASSPSSNSFMGYLANTLGGSYTSAAVSLFKMVYNSV